MKEKRTIFVAHMPKKEYRALRSVFREDSTFENLRTRTHRVIDTVSRMTLGADTIQYGASLELRRKTIVNMGPVAVHGAAKDYTKLCGVTLLPRKPSETDTLDRAEFAVAVVPSDRVTDYIDNPHELHRPNLPGTGLSEPIRTLSVGDVVFQLMQAEHVGEEDYKIDIYRGVRDAVILAEQYLAPAHEAFVNPNLNPQFYSAAAAAILSQGHYSFAPFTV